MRKNKSWIGLVLVSMMLFGTAASFADDDDTTPPPKKNNLKWLQDLSAKADSSSNQSANVAGVLGLEEVGAPPDLTARDPAAIDRLDKVNIKNDELKKFIADGKLS